jgi:hypothetical protein
MASHSVPEGSWRHSSCKLFYGVADVGVLSNNSEKTFGLSGFYDKFIFVGPDIKNDLKIEQAEFQSMVSGEPVVINQKYKTAKSVDWKAPGIFAGNEVPGWCDNSGSISRRVIVFEFSRNINAGDAGLGKKLEQDLPAILKKCAKAYLEAAASYGREIIWDHLPKYFKTLRDDMAAATNSLENFLQSAKIVKGDPKDVYCHWDSFVKALGMHCRELHFTQKTMNKDFYSGPFEKHGLIYEDDRRYLKPYPRHEKDNKHKGPWVKGCDIVDNMPELTSDGDHMI